MDEFLKNVLMTYKLNYIAFRNKSGELVSESKTLQYIAGDSYNIEFKKDVYSSENDFFRNSIGTLEIVNSN